MKTKNYLTILFLCLILAACSSDDGTIPVQIEEEELPTCSDGIQNGDETGVDCGGECAPCQNSYSFSGHAQKGPFLNGSSVIISEFDTNFSPTGRTFTTQIINNTGEFSISDVNLVSPYAQLRVDGFYFNEVCAAQSNAQITLNGFVDNSPNTPVNLNVLTHLEKSRVEYLLDNGTTFDAAKAQAQQEILDIFDIIPSGVIEDSEDLDIANNSKGDAILIAVSSILQGYRSESQFSNLMGDLVSDIRTDGVLDDVSIGENLVAHASYLDTLQIRQNIEERYAQLNVPVTVPDFGVHINTFLTSTTFASADNVYSYPENGINGANILNSNTTSLTNNVSCSLAADLPSNCLSLKIKITALNPNCMNGCWVYALNSLQNWSVSSYDQDTNTQEFVTTDNNADLLMLFSPGEFLIEYFENKGETVTRSKTITVQ